MSQLALSSISLVSLNPKMLKNASKFFEPSREQLHRDGERRQRPVQPDDVGYNDELRIFSEPGPGPEPSGGPPTLVDRHGADHQGLGHPVPMRHRDPLQLDLSHRPVPQRAPAPEVAHPALRFPQHLRLVSP